MAAADEAAASTSSSQQRRPDGAGAPAASRPSAASSSSSEQQMGSGGCCPIRYWRGGSKTGSGAASSSSSRQPASDQTIDIKNVYQLPTFAVGAYEDRIRSAKWSALLVASMQLLSRFLGFFALTWATVVLLGGFIPHLVRFDFYLISSLLLVDGARFFIILTSSKLVSVFRKHQLDILRNSPGEAEKFSCKALLWNGQALSSTLAMMSLGSSITRLALSNKYALTEQKASSDDNTTNLAPSLYIFYILVILGSTFAILASILHPCLRRHCQRTLPGSSSPQGSVIQDSFLCFYDKVYQTAMEAGLAEAYGKVEFLDFASKKIVSDFELCGSRSDMEIHVKALNRDMIHYLYDKSHGEHVMVCEYLKADDQWKQVAGANLVWFWVGEARLESHKELFWALRERIGGTGMGARCALVSIRRLGQEWAAASASWPGRPMVHPFLINDPIADTNVVDSLAHLIPDPHSNPQAGTADQFLLLLLEALEACCRHPEVLRHFYEHHCKKGENPADVSRDIQAQLLGGSSPGRSKLQLLCYRLHAIAEGQAGTYFLTGCVRLYASNTLLSLLCCSNTQLDQAFRQKFGQAVDLKFRYPLMKSNVLVVLEMVHIRLGLQSAAEWLQAIAEDPSVLVYDPDIEGGDHGGRLEGDQIYLGLPKKAQLWIESMSRPWVR